MYAAETRVSSPQRWLRERTRGHHIAAERAMDLPGRLASLSEYAGLLQNLYSLHSAFENTLSKFDWEQIGIDFSSRRRAHWLAEDIVALGGICCELSGHNYSIDTVDEALGALYVLEGSSLGGRVILCQAILIPGVTALRGARYFHGHGAGTMPMWNDFVHNMDRYGNRCDSLHLLEKGALYTFGEFALGFMEKPRTARPICA